MQKNVVFLKTVAGLGMHTSITAPFPCQVTPSKRHRLAAAMSSVDIPLTSLCWVITFGDNLICRIGFRVAYHMLI
ncbi:hypothetical protein E2C01_054885 [Portunus trituberculatus]|uniref:Uncharacterized protein n=1 Tax=Portunus trituberculatus TaxID=210409 RepID=A0A5B7GUG8_PORTR|nr:hypothetical protein [Portunus trituberculatus]